MSGNTRVVTGEVRFSYCHLMKPKVANYGGNVTDGVPKYSTTILIPKNDTDTLARIQAAIQAAKEAAKASKWNGQIPPTVQNSPLPLKDGDTYLDRDGKPLGEECRGHWVLACSTGVDYPPKVFDMQGNQILDHSAVYSGMYGKIALNFAGYNTNGNKGVSAYISTNVQKTRDWEPLASTAPAAENDFNFGPAPQSPFQPPFKQPAPQPTQAQQPFNPFQV